jgi:hypothetical protein
VRLLVRHLNQYGTPGHAMQELFCTGYAFAEESMSQNDLYILGWNLCLTKESGGIIMCGGTT